MFLRSRLASRIRNTPEAEIVAANAAVRLEGLPALQWWDIVLERKAVATLLEDAQATVQILKSSKNPALRYIARTHRVNFAWLSDILRTCDHMDFKYCSMHEQSADIMTKGFTNADNWVRATALIGMPSKKTPNIFTVLTSFRHPPKYQNHPKTTTIIIRFG